MYGDRPARSRKQVDYSKFGGVDDDDDDFVDSTPPVPKKSKKDKLKRKKPEAKKDSPYQPKAPVERASLDEKIFDRELQKALEISRQEVTVDVESLTPTVATSTPLETDPLPPDSTLHQGTSLPQGTARGTGDKENNPAGSGDQESRTKRTSCETTEDLNVIEILEEDVKEPAPPAGRGRRNGGKTKRKYADDTSDEGDSDDDFKVEESDGGSSADDSDDFDPEDDSDYDEAPKKKKGKPPAPKKSKTKVPPKSAPTKKSTPVVTARSKPRSGLVKSSPATPSMPTLQRATPASQRKPLAATPGSMPRLNKATTPGSCTPGSMPRLNKASPLLPARSSPLSAAGKSPGLGGVVIKSPGSATSGVHRPGLSRRANIKPLHSNVKLPN